MEIAEKKKVKSINDTQTKREIPIEEWKHVDENRKVGLYKKEKNWQEVTKEERNWKA